MHYLNSDLPLVFRYLSGDNYRADSVRDFLKHTSQLKPNSRWRWLSPFVSSHWDMTRKGYNLCVRVAFNNVDIQPKIRDDQLSYFKISDPTGNFDSLGPMSSERIRGGISIDPTTITPGRYFSASILYSPITRYAFLENAQKLDLGQGRSQEKYLEHLVASPTLSPT